MTLKRQILNIIPEASVEGEEGRMRSFEITINDKLLFSKLKTKIFPNIDEVIFWPFNII
jgi:hypothetical protein